MSNCSRSVAGNVSPEVILFKIAEMLVRERRPYSDGLLAAKLLKLVPGQTATLDLSPEMIALRVACMSSTLLERNLQVLRACAYFGLVLETSQDLGDLGSHLLVYARMSPVDSQLPSEIFLTAVPFHGRTGGLEMFSRFYERLIELKVPLDKLVSVTTDGSRPLVEPDTGLVALCRVNAEFPEFTCYHTLLHDRDIFGDVLDFSRVLDVLKETVNEIRSGPLQRQMFKSLLNEIEKKYGELIHYSKLHWLSGGSVLSEFQKLVKVIATVVKNDLLKDAQWLSDLAFLTDISIKLDELRDELNDQSCDITNMLSSLNSFMDKLRLWEDQLKSGDSAHFPSLKQRNTDTVKYSECIAKLVKEFDKRFGELDKVKPTVSFLADPSQQCNDVTQLAQFISEASHENASGLEMELIKFKNDLNLITRTKENNFWRSIVPSNGYPILKRVASKFDAFFTSTDLSRWGFDTFEIFKAKYRSGLTDQQICDSLRVSLSKEKDIIYEKLVKEMATSHRAITYDQDSEDEVTDDE